MEESKVESEPVKNHFFIGWSRSPDRLGQMIILSWNCRGLGHPTAIPYLCELVKARRPDVLFLCETLSHFVKIAHLLLIVLGVAGVYVFCGNLHCVVLLLVTLKIILMSVLQNRRAIGATRVSMTSWKGVDEDNLWCCCASCKFIQFALAYNW